MHRTLFLPIAALFCGYASATHAAEFQIPLFIPASHATQEGFIRMINHSETRGVVRVLAVDDAGNEFGPKEIALEARQTLHFNSNDLESGNPISNPDKVPGLETGIGGGTGDWRLVLDTELDLEPLVYVRTGDGFLTSMHDVVPEASMQHEVAIFNPAKNPNQVSRLRLINPDENDVTVSITGVDDKGTTPAGAPLTVELDAGMAISVSATELENGSTDGRITGSFGAGEGKWRLFVSADGEIQVMSLLESTMTGHLTNLSTRTYESLAPSEQAAFDRFMAASGE